MKMTFDFSRYVLPLLGAAAVAGAVLVVSAARLPSAADEAGKKGAPEVRLPGRLQVAGHVPTMEEVVAKHLFVPERVATGENAFPDLLVKGVYVGGVRNAVFSLKSKPEANLRVWQGDEEAAISLVQDERDPRKPIADFLAEWQIRSIDFSGVTLAHLITGEVETYPVDYQPAKHVKDSAQVGYGQGISVVAAAPSAARVTSSSASRPTSGQPGSQPVPGSPAAMAGRVSEFINRLPAEQRQQFLQQLNKQQQQQMQQGGFRQDRQGESSQQRNSGGNSGRNGSSDSRNGGSRSRDR